MLFCLWFPLAVEQTGVLRRGRSRAGRVRRGERFECRTAAAREVPRDGGACPQDRPQRRGTGREKREKRHNVQAFAERFAKQKINVLCFCVCVIKVSYVHCLLFGVPIVDRRSQSSFASCALRVLPVLSRTSDNVQEG